MSRINPLIVALDTTSSLRAVQLVSKLKVTGVAFKIGFELFLSQGPRVVEKIINHEVRVFLDLKFHDIPNTVSRAAREATRMGVWMFNVHAGGGMEMMRAAMEASLEEAQTKKIPPPMVVGVTVLTSMDDLRDVGVPNPVADQVGRLSALARRAGLNGVVASAREAGLIREVNGDDFCIVTPAIRSPDSPHDDQKRTRTAKEALREGANYIVVGCPIMEARTPMKVVDQILSSLAGC